MADRAARNKRKRNKKKMRKVSSLRDVQQLIAMHGDKQGYRTRMNALHGLLHADSIHKLLVKQVRQKGWIVNGIEHLRPLVDAHRAIAASALLFDEMIREMVGPHAAQGAAAEALADAATAPSSSSADLATAPGGASSADSATAPGGASSADSATAPGASSADSTTAPGAASADLVSAPGAALSDPALAPASAPRMLVLATRLVEAGAALGEVSSFGSCSTG